MSGTLLSQSAAVQFNVSCTATSRSGMIPCSGQNEAACYRPACLEIFYCWCLQCVCPWGTPTSMTNYNAVVMSAMNDLACTDMMVQCKQQQSEGVNKQIVEKIDIVATDCTGEAKLALYND